MLKLIKGQAVFLEEFGRRYVSTEIQDAVVTSVGRKYFTIDIKRHEKFHLDGGTNVTNFTASMRVFATREEIEDRNLLTRLKSLVDKRVRDNKLTLSDYIKVANILGIE